MMDDMPNVVAFLQNAWSPVYAGRRWPRERWLATLQDCRSGQRLRILGLPWGCYENVSPEVTETPAEVGRVCEDHVQEILETRKPELVVACGKYAEKTLRKLWNGPLLVVPHPANRVLTNALYELAAAWIREGDHGRVAMRQERDHVSVVDL